MTRLKAVGVALSLSILATTPATLRAQDLTARTIRWEGGYAEATRQASDQRKPLVVFLVINPGENCAKLAEVVTRGPRVNALAGEALFAWQDVNRDDARGSVARLLEARGIDRFPATLVLDCQPDRITELGRVVGYLPDEELAGEIRRLLPAPPAANSGGFIEILPPSPPAPVAPPAPPASSPLPVEPLGGFVQVVKPPPPRTAIEAQAKAAEELFERSRPYQDLSRGDLWLAFTEYSGALRGYRLARHWLDQGQANHPDLRFGYQDARKHLGKARIAVDSARAAYDQLGHAEGIQACRELRGYIDSLADAVEKETSPQDRANPLPAPKPWRAPYGIQ